MMKFSEVIRRTIEVGKRFPKQYDERDHLIDLVEEVGELAQAMQISSGRKLTNDMAKQRTRDDVMDGVCDVLFELIRLADALPIDLEKENPKILRQIEER